KFKVYHLIFNRGLVCHFSVNHRLWTAFFVSSQLCAPTSRSSPRPFLTRIKTISNHFLIFSVPICSLFTIPIPIPIPIPILSYSFWWISILIDCHSHDSTRRLSSTGGVPP